MNLFLSRKYIVIVLLLAAAGIYAGLNIHPILFAPIAFLLLWVLIFFRSPMRRIPAEPLGIVVPVDAVVEDIQRIASGELQGGWQINLISNSGGPYVVRSPMEGKVCDLLWSDGRATEAMGTRMIIESDEGDRIQMQISPRHHRLHGHCSVHPGERVGQGGVCGFVPFGGRFAVFLPEASRILVKNGDQVRAGSDLLAKLIRS